MKNLLPAVAIELAGFIDDRDNAPLPPWRGPIGRSTQNKLTKAAWIERYGGQALLDAEGFSVVRCGDDCTDHICHGWKVVKNTLDFAFIRCIPTPILQLMLDDDELPDLQALHEAVVAELASRTSICRYCDQKFQGAVVPPHDATYDGGEAICPGGPR